MLTQEDVEELEKMAIDVYSLIQTAKNSCEKQDYIPETITLEYAINIQNEIIYKQHIFRHNLRLSVIQG